MSALAFLHANGCAHLDLKCANAMLAGPSQVVKLVDFGTSLKIDVSRLPESRV